MSPRRQRHHVKRERGGFSTALAVLMLLGAQASRAEDVFTVDRCAGDTRIAVVFKADCEHVRAAEDKALCRPFLENQACRMFPAYRKVTGLNLARDCPTITYHLYDKNEWPHPGGDEGGFAGRCQASLLTDFSVRMKSPLGPYDTHELLHLYQSPLGTLPQAHALFGPTQLEAKRVIGDTAAFEQGLARLRTEFEGPEFEQAYSSGRARPAERCRLAESAEEARLYLADTRIVYEFWRTIGRGTERDQPAREAHFNRMLDTVSHGRAREFLLAHGCASF